MVDALKPQRMDGAVHKRTGGRYVVQATGKMKVNGEWVDAVFFTREGDTAHTEMFGREMSAFVENFRYGVTP